MSNVPFNRVELANLVRRTLQILRATDLPLDLPGTDEIKAAQLKLMTQLEARILPHLESSDLPAIIVLGGSSGAGKSTIVNSLVGAEVTEASVLRPTTRVPVALIHPADAAAMDRHVLKTISTYKVSEHALPGIVVIDAPDLDSIEDANRELSNRLLDSADLWLFVTTAARYGDALAWAILDMAHSRGLTCAVALNRVSERALKPVRADLTRRMTELGLEDSPLFVIPDQGPMTGTLPPSTVAELRSWLVAIAKSRMGNTLVDRTTAATLPTLRADLLNLADVVEMQENAIVDLKDKAVEGAQAPIEKLATNISAGRFGQGAPTTAWLSLASTGGPLSPLVLGKKPGLFHKRTDSRDNAATTLFDSVLTSAQVALTQGLVASENAINDAWRNDVVDTRRFLEKAQENLDRDAIVRRALTEWKAQLAALGKTAPQNAWFGPAGNAAIIGSAAGGIVGAMKVAASLGLEKSAWEARAALAKVVREAMEALVAVYVSPLNELNSGNSAVLRLRASELVNYVK
ncbi:energy-coupling factor transporter ATP-binding protein EcfA2 [Arcanobacterium pluranimalium]|uniref:GTPase n=1 Tax=Arcanobacterium pluranimalium TaxID=108028 RepID=UPI00195A2F16|nr:GTPase domain-containing protein [Arcanobacterium pluranimalium]MBM7825726.1 energy-coupling factor transporter ATP-binding protein EcfA2 [Arcanobacterium pluranimalium]